MSFDKRILERCLPNSGHDAQHLWQHTLSFQRSEAKGKQVRTTKKQTKIVEYEPSDAIRQQRRLLGHEHFGITEFRVFDTMPFVAYADNEDDAVRLCLEMEGKTSGIYIGVQPRPSELCEFAPNCWKPARSGPNGNAASDSHIEFITTEFFDIDVVSDARAKGHPASDEELARSLHAAQLLSREDGLAMSSTICCSGNGHYVLAPIVPIPVYSNEEAANFKQFCMQLAARIAAQVSGVKFDPVFNLSRVMRVMGTTNRKGQAVEGRPHRRAHFVTVPVFARSEALHHMILNTDVEPPHTSSNSLSAAIRCDLHKLARCEFVKWCRQNPSAVSEPLWWALITNLAHLEGGTELIHEVSRLDTIRYDYADTQRKIQKAIDAGYRPVSCTTIVSEAMACPGRGRFQCSQIGKCQARAPMYMAVSHTVYTR